MATSEKRAEAARGMTQLSENEIEDLALDELRNLGWYTAFGPDIAFDGPHPEREAAANYGDVVLTGRLRDALRRINPEMPDAAIDEALRQILTQ
ncbi:MAG: hypothetical protein JRC60_07215, partial [Deltaproteobacteria bacterium]|nr:hypothetical protein [Deltaproteobacteria bacterium]